MDLIIGWPGQDSIYLYKLLSENGRCVDRISRNSIIKFDGTISEYQNTRDYLTGDFEKYDRIFFLQAYHQPISSRSRAGNFFNSININTQIVAEIIDYIATTPAKCPNEIIYASSRLCLTSSSSKRYLIPFELSAYTASKVCTEILLESFSRNLSVKSTIFYLYNHESRYRKVNFFFPKFYGEIQKSGTSEFRINPYNLVDIGHSSEFAKSILSFLLSNDRQLVERCEIGTGKLVTLNSILEGMVSTLPEESKENYQNMIDKSCKQFENHQYANLLKLKQHSNFIPSLHGYELGKVLGEEMQSKNEILSAKQKYD